MTLDKVERMRTPPHGPIPRDARRPGAKPRVLYFIVAYPTFSESYMHEEIRSLRDDYDVRIITYARSGEPRREPFPYDLLKYYSPCLVYAPIEAIDPTFSTFRQRHFLRQVDKVIREFQPDLLHAHYMGLGLLLRELSKNYGIPYTIRSHSMDVLSEPPEKLAAMCEAANSEWCERVLSFPANTGRLVEHGLDPAKIVDCWPVLNFARYYRPEKRPPTGRVMNAGPVIKKKAHVQFVDLAHSMQDSGLRFDLYGRGPDLERVAQRNHELGEPITLTYADPDDMPAVYPQYDWLVYTADREMNKVGLPVAICEAMAAGIGVCWQELPGRREEQLDFLGGAGYLFMSIDEVPGIITEPYAEEKRQAGFEAARRCDIEATKHLLSDAWDRRLAPASN